MRNTIIIGLLAGTIMASPAIAQDAGTTAQPAPTSQVPPTDAPTTVDPMADPMADPATDPMSEPMPQPEPDAGTAGDVGSEIDAMDDGALSADQQAAYDAWPAETQSYYSGLTPDRQQLFWRLADADKVALSQLPEAQQAGAWQMIENQAQGMTGTAPAADQPTR